MLFRKIAFVAVPLLFPPLHGLMLVRHVALSVMKI